MVYFHDVALYGILTMVLLSNVDLHVNHSCKQVLFRCLKVFPACSFGRELLMGFRDLPILPSRTSIYSIFNTDVADVKTWVLWYFLILVDYGK